MIDKEDTLPVTRQCEILELCRSGIYYKPVPLSARGYGADASDR